MSSLVEHSMSLSSVFVDVGVDKLHDIVSDRGSEHSRHGDATRHLTRVLLRVNANNGTRSHITRYSK